MAAEGHNDSITRLIEVTERKVREEERVRQLLVGIEGGQVTLRDDIRSLSQQVETLSRCVGGIQQMVSLMAQYMAIVAGRDTDQVDAITRELLSKTGISFGDSAQVGVGGDMVGGDKGG